MFVVEKLFSLSEVAAIVDALDSGSFEGDSTPSGHPSGLQRMSEEPLQLDGEVISKIAHHPKFKSRVFPKRFSIPRFLKFHAGESLRPHLDESFLFGENVLRRDCQIIISFFEPDVEGGLIKLGTGEAAETILLEKGSALVIEQPTVLEVTEITNGNGYLATVACESLVRDPAMRCVASTMDEVHQALVDSDSDPALQLKAQTALQSLLQLISSS